LCLLGWYRNFFDPNQGADPEARQLEREGQQARGGVVPKIRIQVRNKGTVYFLFLWFFN